MVPWDIAIDTLCSNAHDEATIIDILYTANELGVVERNTIAELAEKFGVAVIMGFSDPARVFQAGDGEVDATDNPENVEPEPQV